ADELSCSPSTASKLAGAASSSSAYLLAASPLADLGVFGEESVVYLVCVYTVSIIFAKTLFSAQRETYPRLSKLGILYFEVGFRLLQSSFYVCSLLRCFFNELGHGIMHVMVVRLAFRLL